MPAISNRIVKYLASERGQQQIAEAVGVALGRTDPPSPPRLVDKAREMKERSSLIERIRAMKAKRPRSSSERA